MGTYVSNSEIDCVFLPVHPPLFHTRRHEANSAFQLMLQCTKNECNKKLGHNADTMRIWGKEHLLHPKKILPHPILLSSRLDNPSRFVWSQSRRRRCRSHARKVPAGADCPGLASGTPMSEQVRPHTATVRTAAGLCSTPGSLWFGPDSEGAA